MKITGLPRQAPEQIPPPRISQDEITYEFPEKDGFSIQKPPNLSP